MKSKKGSRQFKVKCSGQEDSDAIWKDETELDCQDLIDEYLKQHADSAEGKWIKNILDLLKLQTFPT